jgi:hypothetical protein
MVSSLVYFIILLIRAYMIRIAIKKKTNMKPKIIISLRIIVIAGEFI